MLCEYPINISNFILPWCVLCILMCFMQGYVKHQLKLNFLEKLQTESQLLPNVETTKFFSFFFFFFCASCQVKPSAIYLADFYEVFHIMPYKKREHKQNYRKINFSSLLLPIIIMTCLTICIGPSEATISKVFTHMTTLKINILLSSKHNICANMHKWTFMALKINSQNL